MGQPMESLIETGTKVWLDSVDPDEVARNRGWGATGATSNPIIISDLIKKGGLDEQLNGLIREGHSDEAIAWELADKLVGAAQKVFRPVWDATKGDDGYVSFELDPLLEVSALDPNDPAYEEKSRAEIEERGRRYLELGRKWSKGHSNRMIKIPNTPGGLAAMEDLAAEGVTINVTLTFTPRQYIAARDALWRGAQRRKSVDQFKSVYSIFVSRVDVYTEAHIPMLSASAQGQVGIVNAKQIWKMNEEFWAGKKLPLKQELIFASTGTKKPEEPPLRYVEAFAGSGIETNPPATNAKIQASGRTFTRLVDQLPPESVLSEIKQKVDMEHLETVLMAEGLKKFADPQRALLALIASRRAAVGGSQA